MGRKKNHSKDELVDKAMHLFRAHGFAGTSADVLVERIGVSRYSLYSEFGNKQGLFDAALKRYNEEVIGRAFGPLEQSDAGLDEIRVLLDFYGTAGDGPASGRGCLLCNTAVEFGPDDPTGAGFVQLYFARLSGAFGNALDNAKKQGRLHRSFDTGKEADFLTSVVLGLFVMIRAKAPGSIIENASRVARERLVAVAVAA
jgi:AcrR family transcriptional regulator